MAKRKIISADVGYKGTQLKIAIVLEGGQKAEFKPKWYESIKKKLIFDQQILHLFWFQTHRVASTPELATNFIDHKQMAGMTTVGKSCYYTVLSRRYAFRWIIFLSEHIYI